MSSANESEVIVYIVDGDLAARQSVTLLVESRGMRTMEFSSTESFLEIAHDDLQGCVIVNVRVEGMSGLDLQDVLVSQNIPLPVIVITDHADVSMAVRAMRAGAVDFLTRPYKPDRLWHAIAEAVGRSRSDRQVREHHDRIERRLETLTEDERAVLTRVVDGVPNKRIARDLDIGLRTVELRRSSLMKKMQADSLAELVQLVVTFGLHASGSKDIKPVRL